MEDKELEHIVEQMKAEGAGDDQIRAVIQQYDVQNQDKQLNTLGVNLPRSDKDARDYILAQTQKALDAGIPLKQVKDSLVAPFIEKQKRFQTEEKLAPARVAVDRPVGEGLAYLANSAIGITAEIGEDVSELMHDSNIPVINGFGAIGESIWGSIKDKAIDAKRYLDRREDDRQLLKLETEKKINKIRSSFWLSKEKRIKLEKELRNSVK